MAFIDFRKEPYYNTLTRRSDIAPLTFSEVEVSMEGILDYLPMTRVSVENGIVDIKGVNSGRLVTAITKIWKTKKLTDNLFICLDYRGLSFYDFFSLEVCYILSMVYDTFKIGLAKNLIDLIQRETWVGRMDQSQALDFDYSQLSRLIVSPLTHQSQWMEYYRTETPKMQLNGNLLHADTGLGKTLMAYMLGLVTKSDTTILICLKGSLLNVFVPTLKTYFKKEPTFWSSDMTGYPTGKEEFIICHYESMDRLSHLGNVLASKKVCIAVDECHNFNEASSTRTQSLIKLVKDTDANNVLFTSATPLKAIGKEAVTLMTCIDKRFTKDVEQRFVGIFGASTGRALDVLNHRLNGVTYRIQKQGNFDIPKEELTNPIKLSDGAKYTLPVVKKDMQDFVEQRIHYYAGQKAIIAKTALELVTKAGNAMPSNLYKEFGAYQDKIREMNAHFSPQAHKDWLKECKDFEAKYIYPNLSAVDLKTFKDVIPKYKYISLVIRGEALGRVLTQSRITCSVAMVEGANFKEIIDRATKKTLILCANVASVKAIGDYLTKQGYQPQLVYQDTNKDLPSILDKMNKDPKMNPLIGTFDSLSTSIPITMCSTLVLHDTPFRDYIRNQAIGRIWRLGQDTPCTIISNVLDTGAVTNVSSRNIDIQEWSKEMVEKMLGL